MKKGKVIDIKKLENLKRRRKAFYDDSHLAYNEAIDDAIKVIQAHSTGNGSAIAQVRWSACDEQLIE